MKLNSDICFVNYFDNENAISTLESNYFSICVRPLHLAVNQTSCKLLDHAILAEIQ